MLALTINKSEVYIIENKFKYNSNVLNTRIITFNAFHIFLGNFKLILLRITAEIQNAMLRSVISHLPSKESGK